MQRRDSRRCVANGCQNRFQPKKLSFFMFPKTEARSNAWASSIKRKDLLKKSVYYRWQNCRVCEIHFEKRMFLNDLRNRLQPHAIPTLEDYYHQRNEPIEDPVLTDPLDLSSEKVAEFSDEVPGVVEDSGKIKNPVTSVSGEKKPSKVIKYLNYTITLEYSDT